MDRRTFVRTTAAAGVAASVNRLRFPLAADASMKAKAAAKGILYGSSAYGPLLWADPAFEKLLVSECAILTPEVELKMGTCHPSATRYDFSSGDALLQFALKNGLKMRGHTLVYGQSTPAWMKSSVTSGTARGVLTEHIQRVCGHYAGKLHSWDVVNEVVEPADHNPDGLRSSPWLTWLGPDYIPLAFQAAHEADPQALLVYNDFGVEYDFPGHDARRTAMLNLLQKLKSQGAPVQAFGLQGHLYGSAVQRMNMQALTSFLKSISDMGLKILVTELDVQDKGLPADPKARDQAVAQSYSTFLNAVLSNTNVILVETWGLSDKYTWLTKHAPRDDGQDVRVLPYDASFQPKSAIYQAIEQAFDAAPPRTV